MEIEVPIKYWQIAVGDFAEVSINRPQSTWLGTRKCEVISKTYNLDRGTITFGIRKYGGDLASRVTTDGAYRITSDGYIRRVGA
jgi:hypothetical protein